MTAEIRGVDLILSQAPKMNMHGVPSYYGSHANNTTMGLRFQQSLGNPTCQPTTNLSEFIAKQVLCRPDSYSKQKPNVRSLWPDLKMMVSPYEINSPFCCTETTITVRQPKSLEDREIGKQFAPLRRVLADQLDILFPDGDDEGAFIVPALDACSQVLSIKIRRNGVGKPVFKLALMEVDSCLPLLHLTCVFLVFPVKCCNGSSLKPARPMCDGRPFVSPLFRRLAGRGALFRGFPFRWVLHIALSLTRSIIVHVATPYSRENPLSEYSRPCDNLSCLCFTALWLQQSQSMLVQEIQPAKDIDLTCFKTFPIKATACLQVGPMSLDWPVDPIARFGHLEHQGSRWIGFSSQKNRELKLKYFRKLFDNNNPLRLQEVHGKDAYLQAVQVLAPRCRFFGTFIPGNENAGGSAICIHKDLLPENAIVTHTVTCQGRDHIVSIQSGRQSLVIVNVHFEPDLTLRRLRERLRLITPHWPSYPNALGIIVGICEPEEGRFNVWNQTFTDGDAGKTAMFHSFFPHVLEIAQPDYTGRDSTALGIDRIFINLPMAKARDFHCYSHVFENLGNPTIPSDHAAVRLVIHKPTIREQQGKRIPSRMSKHSVFCSILKRLHDAKLFLKRPKSRRFVNSHGRHLTAWEQSSLSPRLHCRTSWDARAML